MNRRGAAIAARARSLVGSRFRPQGRRPELGLDCVGLAAAAAEVAADRLPADYDSRGHNRVRIEHALCDLGCMPVPGAVPEAGDVVICAVGPAHFHLLIATGEGFVHADAGLRRVVERPPPLPWPTVGVWRLAGDE